jgi:hypothetical protein
VITPQFIVDYHSSGKPLVCEIDLQPWRCEFWPLPEVDQYNTDYEVQNNAPGYFGFGSSGGGEMYAISPVGSVVCLAFGSMSASEALYVASSWGAFEGMLRPAS